MPEVLSERARVEAGGLVRVGAEVGTDLAIDTVDARGYASAALPGRVVVRLVPDAIAQGVDTEMSLLSFGLATHADDIALQRRRALGFPGATLVIDPDRARYALDVMREFKKHAKRIASKPGHAKDGFDEIGERLSRQVPHFLPSYHEEVARAFAHAGNLTYAGTFFDKARTAEREFGLEVDEERRGEAFLEFALLGALTVKSIQAYGKEVQRLAGADKAFERMFQLATRRTLGGVAPWASLPKDLRGLAKAAKRDVAAEDARFLREVSTASSLKRAPQSFWVEYRDAWIALATDEPAVRARLLDLFPNGGKERYSWREDTSGFTDEWLLLLHACGALDALWSEVPEAARPNGGRAVWLKKLSGWANPGDGFVLQIVRRAQQALAADGVPVPVGGGDWYRPLDLDLVELCLELGLPWTLEPGTRRVDLAKWAAWKPAPARAGLPAEVRPKDPVRAAREPKILELLRPAVDQVFGEAAFEAVASGMDGLKALREDWLRQRIAEISAPGLASTEVALARLEAATSSDHFAEFPGLVPGLKEADVARALATTLSDGLVEEWGWPAWEASAAFLELDKPDADEGQRVQWPWVLRYTARKLCVVGPDGIVAKLDLKHGDGKSLPSQAWYVGGSVLVVWQYWAKGGQFRAAYWSHAVNDTFEVEHRWVRDTPIYPFEHADALIVGTSRFTRGDRAVPVTAAQFHDAEGSWVAVDGKLRAQDRATGQPGAESSPGFLRGGLQFASYHPAPAGGPLVGWVDGQFGSRRVNPARDVDEDEDEGDGGSPTSVVPHTVTLSGHRFEGGLQDGSAEHAPVFLVSMPGRSAVRALAVNSTWRSRARVTDLMLSQADGPRIALRYEGGHHPPVSAWHHLRPRDLAGSRALAAVDTAAAKALLAAAEPAVDGVSDPALRAGVTRWVAFAKTQAERLEKLVAARTTGGVVRAKAAARLSDEELAPALSNLQHYWTYGGNVFSVAVETLGRFLREGETGENVTFSRIDPPGWIGRLRGIAVTAARPGLEGAHRDVLVRALRLFVDAGLAGPSVRAAAFEFSRRDLPWIALVDDGEGGKQPAAAWRRHEGPERIFFTGVTDVGDEDAGVHRWEGTLVQHQVEGPMADPPGATVSDVRVADDADVTWVPAFLEELGRRGPFAVTRAEVERLAEAAGLTPTDAAIVLLGFPQELDKDLREDLGLKHAEVKAACQRLRATPLDEKVALLAARGAGDPASPWDAGAVDRVIAAYIARHGKTVAVDEALLLAADKELGRGGGATVKLVANPGGWKALHSDATYTLDAQGDPEVEDDEETFTPHLAGNVARTVCWLAARLPVGDPIRGALPGVVDLARKRLANPNAWFLGPRWYHYEDKPKKAAKSWFDALPGAAVATDRNDEGEETTWRKSLGAVVVTRTDHWTRATFQWSTLDDAGRQLLDTLSRMAEQDQDYFWPLEVLSSPGMDAWLARLRKTPVPSGGWEQNPLVSAPDLVKTVAKKKKLSADAAAAWLQTMALLEPSKKAVCEWNGWAPRAYDAAMAELVGAGLVIEGKRARAGREHFLPGGWQDPKGSPPYEAWKAGLYGADPRSGRFPLDRMVPLQPLHELFAAAWARCERGDAPAFEEVRR